MAGSWFDPQTILLGLIERMGVSPADFQTGMKLVIDMVREHSAEKAAFKQGAAEMVKYFTRRLDEQDTALRRIEEHLGITRPAGVILRLAADEREKDHVAVNQQ